MAETSPRKVAVVGGGIAGLSAARAAHELDPTAEIVVFEASSEVGGKLRRREVGGVVLDVGAESMLARRPEGVDFATSLGLADEIVNPATTSALLWSRGRLAPLPRTMMGVPADAAELEDVITRKARMRIAVESRLPAPALAGGDIALGRLVEERLGKEVVDRLVEPLLGGVYAGRSRELSARATVPQLMAKIDSGMSLTEAAAAILSVPSSGPVFAGVLGGVGRLAEAAVSAGGFSVELGAHVRDLAKAESGWHLVVGRDAATARIVEADAVVLATPARATARLLSDVAPAAAMDLARVESASVAIVTLAFPARDFPPVDGSGFLVPDVDGRQIKAATFSHRKWEWVAQAAYPHDLVLMRCSLGRHRDDVVTQASDDEIVDVAVRDLGEAIGLSVRPVAAHVERWIDGLPQYAVGHVERVARVRGELSRLLGLAVCGATYDGVGIPAVIASARRAAGEALTAQLPA